MIRSWASFSLTLMSGGVRGHGKRGQVLGEAQDHGPPIFDESDGENDVSSFDEDYFDEVATCYESKEGNEYITIMALSSQIDENKEIAILEDFVLEDDKDSQNVIDFFIDIESSIQYHTLATDLWAELKERFKQGNGPRLYQLRRDLLRLTQERNSVNGYYTKFKVFWDEIQNSRPACTCGKLEEYFQHEYLFIFLMGLDDSISHTRIQILLMEPLPTVNKALALITQEERQRSLIQSTPSLDPRNSMAFAIKPSSTPTSQTPRPSSNYFPKPSFPNTTRPPYNNNNNTYNPSTRPPYNPNYKSKPRPYCTHCNMQGHTIETCFKIHGFPPGYRNNTFRPSTSQANNLSSSTQIPGKNQPGLSDFVQNLNQDQLHQLSSLLNTQPSGQSSNTPQHDPTINSFNIQSNTGNNNIEDDWTGFISSTKDPLTRLDRLGNSPMDFCEKLILVKSLAERRNTWGATTKFGSTSTEGEKHDFAAYLDLLGDRSKTLIFSSFNSKSHLATAPPIPIAPPPSLSRPSSSRILIKLKSENLMGSIEEKLDNQLLILYASQTGNAMDAAERLGREAERRGCSFVSVLSIDEFQPSELANMKTVIFVVSTTGQGDNPDSMKFVAKKLDKRLLDLGATPIIEKGLGDDQHPSGYEGALDPWMSALWNTLYQMNHKLLPHGPDFGTPDSILIDQPKILVNYHDANEGLPPLSTTTG
ncbi:hypothetical protein RD792_016944 [Penstemon davidsonii]|uniref:Flavodoxin-like domain-containing protein n=1 Tax=Penstemon davidsonii TaxID=160366 RepID=A0ABR0CMK5_9LAMI|nr:hypothetical protein RD792_016944 [Penstemon davidsonii]